MKALDAFNRARFNSEYHLASAVLELTPLLPSRVAQFSAEEDGRLILQKDWEVVVVSALGGGDEDLEDDEDLGYPSLSPPQIVLWMRLI